MNQSPIEWTTATWNPVTGCTKVSPGCDHCYAEAFAERFRGVPGHAYARGFDLQLRPERLQQPLAWRKPSLIFVNSMSDLFHARVPESYVREVVAVMRSSSWHTFQILTKRAERLERLSGRLDRDSHVLQPRASPSARRRRCAIPLVRTSAGRPARPAARWHRLGDRRG
jgi:protein gp37